MLELNISTNYEELNKLANGVRNLQGLVNGLDFNGATSSFEAFVKRASELEGKLRAELKNIAPDEKEVEVVNALSSALDGVGGSIKRVQSLVGNGTIGNDNFFKNLVKDIQEGNVDLDKEIAGTEKKLARLNTMLEKADSQEAEARIKARIVFEQDKGEVLRMLKEDGLGSVETVLGFKVDEHSKESVREAVSGIGVEPIDIRFSDIDTSAVAKKVEAVAETIEDGLDGDDLKKTISKMLSIDTDALEKRFEELKKKREKYELNDSEEMQNLAKTDRDAYNEQIAERARQWHQITEEMMACSKLSETVRGSMEKMKLGHSSVEELQSYNQELDNAAENVKDIPTKAVEGLDEIIEKVRGAERQDFNIVSYTMEDIERGKELLKEHSEDIDKLRDKIFGFREALETSKKGMTTQEIDSSILSQGRGLDAEFDRLSERTSGIDNPFVRSVMEGIKEDLDAAKTAANEVRDQINRGEIGDGKIISDIEEKYDNDLSGIRTKKKELEGVLADLQKKAEDYQNLPAPEVDPKKVEENNARIESVKAQLETLDNLAKKVAGDEGVEAAYARIDKRVEGQTDILSKINYAALESIRNSDPVIETKGKGGAIIREGGLLGGRAAEAMKLYQSAQMRLENGRSVSDDEMAALQKTMSLLQPVFDQEEFVSNTVKSIENATKKVEEYSKGAKERVAAAVASIGEGVSTTPISGEIKTTLPQQITDLVSKVEHNVGGLGTTANGDFSNLENIVAFRDYQKAATETNKEIEASVKTRQAEVEKYAKAEIETYNELKSKYSELQAEYKKSAGYQGRSADEIREEIKTLKEGRDSSADPSAVDAQLRELNKELEKANSIRSLADITSDMSALEEQMKSSVATYQSLKNEQIALSEVAQQHAVTTKGLANAQEEYNKHIIEISEAESKRFEHIAASGKELDKLITEYNGLKSAMSKMSPSDEGYEELAKQAESTFSRIKEVSSTSTEALSQAIERQKTIINALNGELQGYNQTLEDAILRGNAKVIAETEVKIQETQSRIQDANNKIQQFTERQKGITNAIDGTSLALKGAKNNVDAIGDAQRKAASEAERLYAKLRENNNAFMQLNGAANGLSGTFRSLVGMAGAGFAFGGALSLVDRLKNTRSEFQQLEISFNTLLQSEEKATVLMNQLVETAKVTPFSLNQVADSAKQLLAYGVSADKVNDTIVRLGDLAAGIGTNIGSIAYLYGTTVSKSNMDTMDFKQFKNRGIPIDEAIAEVMGKSKGEVPQLISQKKVTGEIVDQAISKLTTGDGKFAGMMVNQSKSIGGKISNIGDEIDNVFNDLGKTAEPAISKFLDMVGFALEHIKSIGTAIGTVVVGMKTWQLTSAAVEAMEKQRAAWTEKNYQNELKQINEKIKAENIRLGNIPKEATQERRIPQTEKEKKDLELDDAVSKGYVKAEDADAIRKKREELEELKNTTIEEAEAERKRLEAARSEKPLNVSDETKAIEDQTKAVVENAQAKMEASSAGEEGDTNPIESVTEALSEQKETIEEVNGVNEVKAEVEGISAGATEGETIAEEVNTGAKVENEAATEGKIAAEEAAVAVEVTDTQVTNANTGAENLNTAAETKNTVVEGTNTVATNVNTASKAKNTLVTKAATLATTLWGNVTKAATGVMNWFSLGLTQARTAVNGLTAAIAANPFGTMIVALTTVIGLLWSFDDLQEENKSATQKANEELEEQNKKLKENIATLKAASPNSKLYKDAYKDITDACEAYGVAIDANKLSSEDEAERTQELTRIHNELADAYKREAKEKADAALIEDQTEKLIELQKKFGDVAGSYLDNMKQELLTKGMSKDDFEQFKNFLVTIMQTKIDEVPQNLSDKELRLWFMNMLKGIANDYDVEGVGEIAVDVLGKHISSGHAYGKIQQEHADAVKTTSNEYENQKKLIDKTADAIKNNRKIAEEKAKAEAEANKYVGKSMEEIISLENERVKKNSSSKKSSTSSSNESEGIEENTAATKDNTAAKKENSSAKSENAKATSDATSANDENSDSKDRNSNAITNNSDAKGENTDKTNDNTTAQGDNKDALDGNTSASKDAANAKEELTALIEELTVGMDDATRAAFEHDLQLAMTNGDEQLFMKTLLGTKVATDAASGSVFGMGGLLGFLSGQAANAKNKTDNLAGSLDTVSGDYQISLQTVGFNSLAEKIKWIWEGLKKLGDKEGELPTLKNAPDDKSKSATNNKGNKQTNKPARKEYEEKNYNDAITAYNDAMDSYKKFMSGEMTGSNAEIDKVISAITDAQKNLNAFNKEDAALFAKMNALKDKLSGKKLGHKSSGGKGKDKAKAAKAEAERKREALENASIKDEAESWKDLKDAVKQLRDEEDAEFELRQLDIDLMDDGIEKTKEQLALDRERKLLAIERNAEDEKFALVEDARAKHDKHEKDEEEKKGKKNYTKKTFDAKAVFESDKPEDAEKYAEYRNRQQDIETATDKLRASTIRNLDKSDAETIRKATRDERMAMLEYLQEYGDLQEKIDAIREEYKEKLIDATENGLYTNEANMIISERDKKISEVMFENDKLYGSLSLAFGNIEQLADATIDSLITKMEQYRDTALKSLSPVQIQEFMTQLSSLYELKNERQKTGFKLTRAEAEEMKRQLLLKKQEIDAQIKVLNAKKEELSAEKKITEEKVKQLLQDNNVTSNKEDFSDVKLEDIPEEARGEFVNLINALKELTVQLKNNNTETSNLTGQSEQTGQAAEAVKGSSKFASFLKGGLGQAMGAKGAGAIAIVDTIVHGINDNVQSLKGLADDLTDTFDALGKDTDSRTGIGKFSAGMSMFAEASQNATNAWESLKSGNIMGVIQGVVGSFTAWIKGFARLHDSQFQEDINDLEKELKDLGNAYNEIAWKAERAYSKMKANYLDEETRNLEKQKQILQEEINLENQKKDKDEEAIKDRAERMKDLDRQIIEHKEQAMDAIFGEDIKSAIENFTSAWAEAWANNESRAKSAKDYVVDMMKRMVLEMVKSDLMEEDFIKNIRDKAARYLQDKNFSEEEQADLENEIAYVSDIMDERYKGMDKLLKGKTITEGASRGGFEAMSQDSSDELNGRFAALQMSGETIKEYSILNNDAFSLLNATAADIARSLSMAEGTSFSELLRIQNESYIELQAINTNTQMTAQSVQANNALLNQLTQQLRNL